MGLHMRNIVEHQSTDRDVLEIVEARRRGSGPAERLSQLVVVGVIGQRDVGEEAAGLILQGPEREQVVRAVRHGLHVSIQHGAVRGQAESVGLAMHRQPFLARELLVGNGGARGGAEYFGAATRKARDAEVRSEEHTSELQSPCNLVCRLLLEKKKYTTLSVQRY